MIKFKNPHKTRMASGDECLLLTDAGTWESFPAFAEEFISQLGASVLRKIDLPDIHLWEIEYEGAPLRLVYDDFPNGVSVEPIDSGGRNAIEDLFQMLKRQSDETGL